MFINIILNLNLTYYTPTQIKKKKQAFHLHISNDPWFLCNHVSKRTELQLTTYNWNILANYLYYYPKCTDMHVSHDGSLTYPPSQNPLLKMLRLTRLTLAMLRLPLTCWYMALQVNHTLNCRPRLIYNRILYNICGMRSTKGALEKKKTVWSLLWEC